MTNWNESLLGKGPGPIPKLIDRSLGLSGAAASFIPQRPDLDYNRHLFHTSASSALLPQPCWAFVS